MKRKTVIIVQFLTNREVIKFRWNWQTFEHGSIFEWESKSNKKVWKLWKDVIFTFYRLCTMVHALVCNSFSADNSAVNTSPHYFYYHELLFCIEVFGGCSEKNGAIDRAINLAPRRQASFRRPFPAISFYPRTTVFWGKRYNTVCFFTTSVWKLFAFSWAETAAPTSLLPRRLDPPLWTFCLHIFE